MAVNGYVKNQQYGNPVGQIWQHRWSDNLIYNSNWFLSIENMDIVTKIMIFSRFNQILCRKN